jgi:hypothetical protein
MADPVASANKQQVVFLKTPTNNETWYTQPEGN